MHRLFVALKPPVTIRRALLTLMSGIPGARWQDDDQLHITLRYIGEVDRPQAEDIAAALGIIHAPALTLSVEGVGRFDSRGRANAVWAGVRPVEAITALHRKIDAALVRAGLEPERRAYLPHITLARLNAPIELADRFVADHAGLRSDPFALDSFGLFESHLSRDSARYEMIARYRLDTTD